MKDNNKNQKQNGKESLQEEFGMEFGDFNAAKHFEIPEANRKSQGKKKC